MINHQFRAPCQSGGGEIWEIAIFRIVEAPWPWPWLCIRSRSY